MAIDLRKYAAPVDKPWRVIDYVNDKFLALWGMSGPTPDIAACFEYWDEASHRGGSETLERVARTMNIAEGVDPHCVIAERQQPPAGGVEKPSNQSLIAEAIGLVERAQYKGMFALGTKRQVIAELTRLLRAIDEHDEPEVRPS